MRQKSKFFLRVGNFWKDQLSKVKEEILANRLTYFFLAIILFFSAFLRLYRLDELLGFWFDQGRDALVIWDLLHYRKFFLIGPVTGIEGIFLGPFYYYLLAPFYWLGEGSPVFAAAGLVWLTVAAIFLLYFLGAKVYNRRVGLLAAFLYCLSYEFVTFSRWLANPNPLPFFALITLILLLKAIENRPSLLILVGLFLGLCLQLEAASAIFFLPAVLITICLERKCFFKLKLLFGSFLGFFATLMPQLIFNFRHQGILFQAFNKFLLTERSFRLNPWETARLRLSLYYDVFLGKIFAREPLKILTLSILLTSLVVFRRQIFSRLGKVLIIWLTAPLLGFLFYQGNYGYVWDYYFTGVQPAFVIIFSAGCFYLARRNFFFKLLLAAFLISFLAINFRLLRTYYKTGIGITLAAQTRALDWIYQDVGKEDFNVAVYVPPQIYFSYSYLFRWYGGCKYGRGNQTPGWSKTFILFTNPIPNTRIFWNPG